MTYKLWIVRAVAENGGPLYLPDYAGLFRADVLRKVHTKALAEGFRGDTNDRLTDLGWEIVEIEFREVVSSG